MKSGVYHNTGTVILALDHPHMRNHFYAISGCDTASSFYSKGKFKLWDVWMQNWSNLDEVFIRPGDKCSDVKKTDINAVENFVMKMYTKLSKIS